MGVAPNAKRVEHALCALGNADSLRDPLARGRLEGDLEAAVDGGGDCARARAEGMDGEARGGDGGKEGRVRTGAGGWCERK